MASDRPEPSRGSYQKEPSWFVPSLLALAFGGAGYATSRELKKIRQRQDARGVR